MSKRPIRTRSLSLKCADLRCKKSLVEECNLRPARDSFNSQNCYLFDFIFIPSQKIPISHCSNFSYDIKVYSPFYWSLTCFVWTSGSCLFGCWDSTVHLPYCPAPSLKSLHWQTYSSLTDQSETSNERKKRQNNSPQRTYSTEVASRNKKTLKRTSFNAVKKLSTSVTLILKVKMKLTWSLVKIQIYT